jgi:hypothetical protein
MLCRLSLRMDGLLWSYMRVVHLGSFEALAVHAVFVFWKFLGSLKLEEDIKFTCLILLLFPLATWILKFQCSSIFHSMLRYPFLIYLCRGFWRSIGNCVLYDFLFSDNIFGYVESLAIDDGSIGRFCYRLLSKYESLRCLYTWLDIWGKFHLHYCDYILVFLISVKSHNQHFCLLHVCKNSWFNIHIR